MILLLIVILFNCFEPSPVVQEKNFWHKLAEVGFKKVQRNGYEMEAPVFSTHLKNWNGKTIKLKGYVIPVGEVGDESKFMFSSLPFHVYYFCGAVSPKTIMEVELTEEVKFTSQAIWMEGILQLNEKHPDRHIYILNPQNLLHHDEVSVYFFSIARKHHHFLTNY